MNIPELSTAMAMTNVQQQFSVEMLSKTMDTVEDMSAGMIDMIQKSSMEQSINPHICSNIDILL